MPVESKREFHFIVANQSTQEEARRNRHSARSHTARVNRIRYLNQRTPHVYEHASHLSGVDKAAIDDHPHNDRQKRAMELPESRQSIMPLRRTLSPVYGTLSPETFEPGRTPTASYVLRYCKDLE